MRQQFKFWLDDQKPDEAQLIEVIDDLKANRAFSEALRTGLKLYADLSEGDTSLLFERFGHILRNGEAPVTVTPQRARDIQSTRLEVKEVEASDEDDDFNANFAAALLDL